MKLSEIITQKVKAMNFKLEDILQNFTDETGLIVKDVDFHISYDAFGKNKYTVISKVEIQK